MSAPELAATVGGIIECHYAHPQLGPVYPIKLGVATFDQTPSGPNGDYLYDGAGGYQPTETGVLATFAALAALWAPYYDASWTLWLAAVYANTGGLPQPALALPTAASVNGTGPAPTPGASTSKRSIALFSTLGARWRIWLRQLPVVGIGETVDVASNAGGIDARDPAWFAYFLAGGSGIVGRDGMPIDRKSVV